MYSRILLLVVALFIAIGWSAQTSAHSVGSSFYDGLISSDFIFKGEVLDVAYRSSTPRDARQPALAHTFVTYRVDQILKGSIAGTGSGPPDTLTLRFMGGAAGNDEYELVSGTPLFDIGDTDVLMVEGNGRSACPLVRCLNGRYRVIDGLIYGDDGQEVIRNGEVAVLYGRFHHLRDVMVNQVGPVELVRVGEVEVNETGAPVPQPITGTHHTTDSFIDAVVDELAELNAAGVVDSPDPLQSQDIDTPFTVDIGEAVPISGSSVEDHPADPGSLFSDRIELLLIQRNGGNPILSEHQSEWLNRFKMFELQSLNRREIGQDRIPRDGDEVSIGEVR